MKGVPLPYASAIAHLEAAYTPEHVKTMARALRNRLGPETYDEMARAVRDLVPDAPVAVYAHEKTLRFFSALRETAEAK